MAFTPLDRGVIRHRGPFACSYARLSEFTMKRDAHPAAWVAAAILAITRIMGCRPVAVVLLCTGLLPSAAGASAQTLVLVSIDGFRHDYLARYQPANMLVMAEQGFVVDRVTPVYPSNTFPAHLSLITGLKPEQHGIEDNHFCHADRGDCYHMGGGRTDASWLRGVPLWNWVEANGGIAATYFWPESDARWGGRVPTYYLPYSKSAPYADRVNQVLNWLRLPEQVRPNFITLYFSSVDTAGHRFGPNSEQVSTAINALDKLIGGLWAEIQALEDPNINLLLVSDHGMTALPGDRAIPPEALPLAEGFDIMRSDARIRYYPRDPGADVERLLLALKEKADPRYRVLTAPEAMLLGGTTAQTVAPVTLVARAPTFFARAPVPASAVFGGHGYAPDHPDMAAFALGVGPAFRAVRVGQAHQLEFFPLMLAVLGYPAPPELSRDAGGLKSVLQTP